MRHHDLTEPRVDPLTNSQQDVAKPPGEVSELVEEVEWEPERPARAHSFWIPGLFLFLVCGLVGWVIGRQLPQSDIAAVKASIVEGQQLGLRGRSTFFMNGYQRIEAQPFSVSTAHCGFVKHIASIGLRNDGVMQTPSHFLITAFLNRQAGCTRLPIPLGALLIGAVLPDLPFTLLTLGGEIYYRWFAVLPTRGSIMEYLHLTLFFTDPVWLVSHNFFHSLVINTALMAGGYYAFRRRKPWGLFVFWLAVSMVFHTLIDIVTHHTDGPLFLFPINGSYRFASPISYWEPAYHGHIFMTAEYILDALILSYFGWQWSQRRRQEMQKRYA